MSSEITVRDLMSRMGMTSGSESFRPINKNHSSNQPFISQHSIQKSIVYAAAESIRFTETMVASGESVGDAVSKVKEYVIKIWKKIVAFFKEIITKIKGFLSKSKSSEDDFEKALDGISKVLSTPKKKGTAEDAKKVYNYRSISKSNSSIDITDLIYDISVYGTTLQYRIKDAVRDNKINKYLDHISNNKWKNNNYTINDFKNDQNALDDSMVRIKDIEFTENLNVKTVDAHREAEKILKEYLTFKSKFKSQNNAFKATLDELSRFEKELEKQIKSNEFISVENDDDDGTLTTKAANFLQQAIQVDIRKFTEKINEYNSVLKISISHIKEMAAIYLQTNYSSYEL